MLELKIARNSPFEKEAILVKEALASQCESIALNSHFVLHVNEEIYLSLENSEISEKDFKIDVFNEKLLWRLNHSGKNSEAVCRAVIGKLSKPVVFDATAGLGRESLILQSAGARVYMFERNPVIWLLLVSAMKKAQVSPDIFCCLTSDNRYLPRSLTLRMYIRFYAVHLYVHCHQPLMPCRLQPTRQMQQAFLRSSLPLICHKRNSGVPPRSPLSYYSTPVE